MTTRRLGREQGWKFRTRALPLLVAGLLLGGPPTAALAAAPGPTAAGMGFVRVVHALADGGKVDVYLNGELEEEGVGFGAFTGFLPVRAGTQRVELVPPGGSADDPLLEHDVKVTAGQAYEVAAVGRVGDDTVAARVHRIDLSPLAKGRSRVRTVNAAPGAGAVEVLVDQTKRLARAPFGRATAYTEIKAGRHDLELRSVAGATDAAVMPRTLMRQGLVYSVYTMDQAGADSDGLGVVLVPARARDDAVRGVGIYRGDCDAPDAAPRFTLRQVGGLQPAVTTLEAPPSLPEAPGDATPASALGAVLKTNQAALVGTSTTELDVGLGEILRSTHSIVVQRTAEDGAETLVCGVIRSVDTTNGVVEVLLQG